MVGCRRGNTRWPTPDVVGVSNFESYVDQAQNYVVENHPEGPAQAQVWATLALAAAVKDLAAATREAND